MFRLAWSICFVYKESDYEVLLDEYELIAREFSGWTLADIRSLSYRERMNWIDRAQRYRGGRK